MTTKVAAKVAEADLTKTARQVDAVLEAYLEEYHKVVLEPRHYTIVDAFTEDYLNQM